jgi:hypothetical protein
MCSGIVQYLGWLESEVSPLLAKRSSTFWICLDRRLPPGFDQQGDSFRRQRMAEAFNAIKTILFQKYGRPDPEPFTVQEDNSFDFQVDDEDIVSLFGSLRPYFHELAYLPNEYRRVAKGATLVHKEGIGLVSRFEPALENLVRLYDERRATTGSTYLSNGGIGNLEIRTLSPHGEGTIERLSTLAAIPTPGDREHVIREMGRVKIANFELCEVFLERLEDLRPFESHFIEIAGVTLNQLKGCYVALKRYILNKWSPHAEYTLICRGIWFTEALTLRRNLRQEYEAFMPIETVAAEIIVDRFLQILQGEPRSCDLLLRQRQSALSISSTICALDLSATPNVLGGLLLDMVIDDEMKRIKGDRFEHHVTQFLRDTVPDCSYPVRPGLALKRHGERNPFAQVDTYAQVEDILFLIEAKAYSVTRDYLKGTPQAVYGRWRMVENWLRKADTRAGKVVNVRKGSNFSIPEEVRFIVPVVCSAFVEFVWSQSNVYYLDEDLKIPRGCTLDELVAIMSGSLEKLREMPATLRIQ